MQLPSHPDPRPNLAPTFYLTTRQPLHPAVLLLAIAGAVVALCAFIYAMDQVRHTRLASDRADSASSPSSHADDDKDDPNQIDTIVLGDPGEAPVPARHDHHVSPVHPTIVVRLPRFGDQNGLIPNSPAGQVLYSWLFAFNHTSARGLAEALPSAAPEVATAVQLALRQKTGGFNLLSAKEVQPGLLVFRLRDQTPAGGEVLGTLQLRPDSSPPAIASFSLRAVGPPELAATKHSAPGPKAPQP